MSADNYYVIRRHPNGGFTAVMGCASVEEDPEVCPEHHQSFPTVQKALDSVNSPDDWTEYGTHIHAECEVITTHVSPFDIEVAEETAPPDITRFLETFQEALHDPRLRQDAIVWFGGEHDSRSLMTAEIDSDGDIVLL